MNRLLFIFEFRFSWSTTKHQRRRCTIHTDSSFMSVFDCSSIKHVIFQNSKRLRSATQLSFIPLYYIYLLLAMVIQFAIKLIGPLRFATMLPSPSFLYFYFHHWTFFNSTKSLLMLGYKPELGFKECVNKCAQHYRELRKKDVRTFSWQNSIIYPEGSYHQLVVR